MKKISIIAAIAFSALALTTTSCGKYEDGPSLSLLTKKQRLCREWDAKSLVDSNGTTYEDNSDDVLTFEKEGGATYTNGGNGIAGTWEFASDKEQIKTTYTVFGITDTDIYTIMRLTNKELWLKDSDGDLTKYEAR